MASSATRSLLLILGATALAVACSNGAPGPRIDSVSPVSARNTSATVLTIAGKNFYRKIVPDAGSPSSSTASDVRVVLSSATTSFELVLSSSMSVSQLSGPVAAGHPVGPYDVTVFADGGSYTAHGAFTISGPPIVLAFTSATEALPGTADVITLSATLRDAAGTATSPDAPVNCTLASPGAVAASLPSSFSIAVDQTGALVDITDKSVEAFSVGCSNSLAPLTLTTGSAAFIAGPSHTAKVLSASEAAPFTSNKVDSVVVLTDVDGNVVSTNPSSVSVPLSALQTGGTACSVSLAPTTVTIVAGTSFGAFTASGASCIGGGITWQVTPSAAGLVNSAGILTWQ